MEVKARTHKAVNGKADAEEECGCLLIQVDPINLLVPRVLVAEVVQFNASVLSDSVNDDIDILEWRSRQVPMIKPQLINPLCLGEITENSKVLVFHGLLDSEKLPFFALLCSKNPRLIQFSAESIVADDNVEKVNFGELQSVLVNGETAVIPKVDFLERYILDNL